MGTQLQKNGDPLQSRRPGATQEAFADYFFSVRM
jgi:hypothetical protein